MWERLSVSASDSSRKYMKTGWLGVSALSRYFQVFALLCILSLFFGTGVPSVEGRSDKDDEKMERIYEIENNLRKKAFPPEFADSIRVKNKIPLNQEGLRSFGQNPFDGHKERLVYSVNWGFILAGYGILGVGPNEDSSKLELNTFAISRKVVGLVYKVRDFARCLIDKEGFYPVFFEEHIREGRYRTTRWEVFDHESGRVVASKKKHSSKSAPPYSQNYISAFYFMRTFPFGVGDTVRFKTFVQGKKHNLNFVCVGREIVEMKDGTEFKCLRVRPFLEEKAMVFSRGDRVDIWLTDDEYRVPVLVEAKIKWGTIRCWLEQGSRVELAEEEGEPNRILFDYHGFEGRR